MMRFRLRTLLIVVAMLPPLIGGAGMEVCRYLKVAELGRTRKLPPTMYSEPLGMAVALIAVAMIVLIVAARKDDSIAAR